MALLKFSLKTNIIKSIYSEIYSNISNYYYCFGKSKEWPTVTDEVDGETIIISDENQPPAPIDSYVYEVDARRDIIYLREINTNDAAIVVRRINWLVGYIYDQYDDYSEDNYAYSGATTLSDANYYAMTTDYNVYKCLFNNNGAQSLNQPVGVSHEAFETSDGYIWKFMYTVPLYLRNKFLTSSWMPVTTALTNQFYSNGSIIDYVIEDGGAEYVSTAWKIKEIIVKDGGSNYDIGDLSITFPIPDSGVQSVVTVNSISVEGKVESISVTEAGEGYTYQPQPIISSTQGTGLDIIVEYEPSNALYTELTITGDGYNENNPYSLKEITITNRGDFDPGSVPAGELFTFPQPQKTYGRFPDVDVTFRLIDGTGPNYEVDEITIVDEGYGYTEPLIFGSNVFAGPLIGNSNTGFDCDLNSNNQQNPATAIPLIGQDGTLKGISITDSGIGYTYASIDVKLIKLINPVDPTSAIEIDENAQSGDIDYIAGFQKASMQLQFSIGDIETKQSTVELLAVSGSIPVVIVENPGIGYTADATLEIVGDGSGCNLSPIISNGSIIGVDVIDQGEGYSYATITASGSGVNSQFRAIIAPKGGHGSDAVSELSANTILMTSTLSGEEMHGVEVVNDFRQISIIKNPKVYGGTSLYKNSAGTTAILATGEKTSGNTIAYNSWSINQDVYLSSKTDKHYTLLNKKEIDGIYYFTFTVNDNYIPTAGNVLTEGVVNFTLSSVTEPEVNKFTGDLIYIDNRIKFASSNDQAIVTSTLISF